jgi:transposase InsO family protein
MEFPCGTEICLAMEMPDGWSRASWARSPLGAYGPEFVSKVLDRWAYECGVTLDFSRPGKPTDNAYVESFNGRLREECLNVNWLLSLEDAQAKI